MISYAQDHPQSSATCLNTSLFPYTTPPFTIAHRLCANTNTKMMPFVTGSVHLADHQAPAHVTRRGLLSTTHKNNPIFYSTQGERGKEVVKKPHAPNTSPSALLTRLMSQVIPPNVLRRRRGRVGNTRCLMYFALSLSREKSMFHCLHSHSRGKFPARECGKRARVKPNRLSLGKTVCVFLGR